MDSATSDPSDPSSPSGSSDASDPPDPSHPVASAPYLPEVEGEVTLVKFVVVGPLGVGKTTMITSLSDYEPMTTDEPMTQAGEEIDQLRRQGKTETTVAMDFGRITLHEDLIAYLFGAPGQDRFQALWDDMTYGALGAVVLADTQRLDDSFHAMDRLEALQLPYLVAVNAFDGNERYEPDELREAFQLAPDTPLLTLDARERSSSKLALVELVRYLQALNSRYHLT
jgi:uncharacterized protein